jgi:protein-arginine deiminase
LRAAGRVVFQLRGKDVGAIVSYDPRHDDDMDSLNSFGNMETIPPYTLAGKSFPYGRILRGKTPTWYPDPAFIKMVESQGVQDPVYVDTEWLIVGHVDEFLSYIPVSSPRGWALLVADPTMGKKMLTDLSAKGLGSTRLHEGKFVFTSTGVRVSATKTVAQVLADQDVMSSSQLAQGKIDKALAIIRDATGLTDDEIIHVPTLFESEFGATIAWDPGTVNGIVLGNRFAAPKAHSALVEGRDSVQKAFEDALVPRGMVVDWVEDWDTYHINMGEVHCGSNVRRTPPAKPFWMQGVKR